MAVPTLTSITPDNGHPGGRELIRIDGSNFELPPSPAPTGYVGGSVPESVQVEIDGEFATDVKVWTSGILTCLTPPYRGTPSSLSHDPGYAVDVTIRNLTGPEEDTFTDAFSYKRRDLARRDGALAHVCKTLVRELRRQVIDNVAVATQVDFDGDPSDGLDIVELATVPALTLFGPDMTEDKARRGDIERPQARDLTELEYYKHRYPRIEIVSFEVGLVARGTTQSANLIQEFIGFFNRYPKLVVDIDSTDPSAGTVEFDMFLTNDPSRIGRKTHDDILTYSATFEIHGVPIDSDTPTRIEWGKILESDYDTEFTYEQQET
jgi:hypothetical protein